MKVKPAAIVSIIHPPVVDVNDYVSSGGPYVPPVPTVNIIRLFGGECAYNPPDTTDCAADARYVADISGFYLPESVTYLWTVVSGAVTIDGSATSKQVHITSVAGTADIPFRLRCVASLAVPVESDSAELDQVFTHVDGNAPPVFIGPAIQDSSFVSMTALGGFDAALRYTGDNLVFAQVGVWPPGITMDAAGWVGGTPTTPGSYPAMQTSCSNSQGVAYSNAFSMTITSAASPAVEIVQTVSGACDWASPNGCVAQSSYHANVFNMAPTSYVWEITSVFSGNPVIKSGQGSTDIVIESTGSLEAFFNLKITVTGGGTATMFGQYKHLRTDLTTAPVFIGPLETHYYIPRNMLLDPINVSSKFSGYIQAFQLTGPWPTGIAINNSGVIYGQTTDPVADYGGVAVRAVNYVGADLSDQFTMVVQEVPLFIGQDINNVVFTKNVPIGDFDVTGLFTGTDLVYSAVGTWPNGIDISSAGIISGTPHNEGVYPNMIIRAVNGVGGVDSNAFQITVQPAAAPQLSINQVVAGVCNFTAPGGCTADGTYEAVPENYVPTTWVWSITSVLAGNPVILSGQGTSQVVVRTTGTVDATFTLKCIADVTENVTQFVHDRTDLTVAPTFIGPDFAVLNMTYNVAITPINAALKYSGYVQSYSLIGVWPPGISINPTTGQITGTPTSGVTQTFTNLTVRATNYVGSVDSNVTSVSLTGATAPVIADITDKTWTQGVAITPIDIATFTTGSGPITYSISAGALPAGVTLSGSVISGTPSVGGTGSVTVRATNPAGFDDEVIGWTSAAATAPVIAAIPDQNWVTTGPITPIDVATGITGTPPFTYTVSAGAFPTGVTMTAGVISGTPVGDATGSVTVRATNAVGFDDEVIGWQTAASFGPPFHALAPDPTTKEMKGVLVGTGSMTTTHTSVAYALDKDGVYRNFDANEPVWSGGRTVRNIIPHSQNMADAGWVVGNATKTTGITDPLGGTTAARVTATAANGRLEMAAIPYQFIPNARGSFITSMWIRRVSGVGNVSLKTGTTDSAPTGTHWINPTATWKRYSMTTFCSGAGYAKCLMSIQTSGDVFECAFGQSEFVPNPGDLRTGAELCAEAGFDSGQGGWGLTGSSTGWSFSGGKAIASSAAGSSGYYYMIPAIQAGKNYILTIVVDSMSAGGLSPILAYGINNEGTFRQVISTFITTAGTYHFALSCPINTGQGQISFQTAGTTTCQIDYVGIKECSMQPGEFLPTTTVTASKTYNSATANSVGTDGSVIDAVGADLPEMPYLQYYPAATNAALQSRDQTNAAWTNTNVTALFTQDGLDGRPVQASLLTATAANGTCIAAAAVTAASGTHAACFYLKRSVGTGQVSVTLDNGATWNNVTLTTAYQKFTFEQAALTNPQLGIRLATSGDAVIVGNVECHTAKTLSQVLGLGPIFTTTAAVATVETVYNFSTANFNAVSQAWYMESSFSQTLWDNNNWLSLLGGTGSRIVFKGIASSDWGSTATPNQSVISGQVPLSLNKVAAAYNSTDNKLTVNINNNYGSEVAFTTINNAVLKIRNDGSTNRSAFKLRETMGYTITSFAEGKTIIDGLMAGP
jgi:hypothetical protein